MCDMTCWTLEVVKYFGDGTGPEQIDLRSFGPIVTRFEAFTALADQDDMGRPCKELPSFAQVWLCPGDVSELNE